MTNEMVKTSIKMMEMIKEMVKEMFVEQTKIIGVNPEALRMAATGMERLEVFEDIIVELAKIEDQRNEAINEKLDKIMAKLEM